MAEEKVVEEQAQSLYPFDGRDLLVELAELCERMAGVENEHAAEVVHLSRTSLRIRSQLKMSWQRLVSFLSTCGRTHASRTGP
jgi:hypothetical protein